jgi:hypothetical protein
MAAASKPSKKPKQKKLPVEAAKGFLTSSAHDEDSSSHGDSSDDDVPAPP